MEPTLSRCRLQSVGDQCLHLLYSTEFLLLYFIFTFLRLVFRFCCIFWFYWQYLLAADLLSDKLQVSTSISEVQLSGGPLPQKTVVRHEAAGIASLRSVGRLSQTRGPAAQKATMWHISYVCSYLLLNTLLEPFFHKLCC